ncbi:translation initiation factor IF-2 N-terminal domain-containing protein, partial [Pseudomonas viridiflava]|uniref:translation initiation factor IF-2 N-terminal domain-containing protein n=3 Tax=Pseudomonas TaxID=286 RepID=UPI00197EE40B
MTQVTVKELAKVVDTPVERLLQQMREAGLPHTAAEQVVTDNEKQALLTHLKSGHKAKVEEPRKITLQRKTTSTLRVAGSKSISVEVRKKKVFVQRSPEEIEAERKREMDERRAVENAARQKAEEEAKRREEDAPRQPAAAQTAEQPAPAAAQPVAAAEPAREASAAPAPAHPNATPTVEVRKRDDQRRPDKPRADDRNARGGDGDRKNAPHRASVKEKAPAPRVAPRTTDEESDGFRRGGRGKSKLKKRNAHGFQSPTGPVVRDVAIGETITVGELSAQMSVKAAEVIKFMFKMGTPVTINQVLDQETAQLIAEELGHKVTLV